VTPAPTTGWRDAAAHLKALPTRTRDLAVLGGVVVIAALLRLPGIAERGGWDSDQGVDMATLQAFVTHGVVPLLGPQTSIGNVHHGALYYYLLAPAAIPAGGTDPTAVVLWIALAGIAAVGVVWWLGRAIGGPVAGLIAGLLAATSATAVGGSTFIWNPNLLPLAAALALAFGWRAWTTRNARWWLAAGAAQAVVQQAHLLGIVALPALAALWLADLRRGPERRRSTARWGLAGLGVIALGYLPLLLHELGSGFDQTRAALDFLRAGGDASGPGLVFRLFFVPLRIAAWPLVGLVTDAPAAAVIAVVAGGSLVGWRIAASRGAEATATRWLVGWVVSTTLLLTLLVASLATVTPLPVDHYHAFVDPAVLVLVGIGAAALWKRDLAGRGLAVVGVTALVAWNLGTQPPAMAANGDWPAAREAAARLAAEIGDVPTALLDVPPFKPVTAYSYPLGLLGVTPVDVSAARRLVVICDDLFEGVVGVACRGPAEAAALDRAGVIRPVLLDRFAPAPGRTISVYERASP
jgi:4-amino-4-deoxy-L-arabinose transferase-like glycosyltransferase